MRTDLLRFNGAVERDPAIDAWMKEHAGGLGAIAHQWFEVMRKCGDEVRELLHDGCPVACLGDAPFGYVNVFHSHVKRGVLSRRSAAGPGSLVARHRQVHAPCEAGTGNGRKRRSAKQADRHGVLGYKGARRKRLAQRSASRGRRGCEPPNMSNTHRGRMRGYAEVILVHSTAPLLPACRQSAQNPVFHFPQPRFVAHEGHLSMIPALRPSATRSVTTKRCEDPCSRYFCQGTRRYNC